MAKATATTTSCSKRRSASAGWLLLHGLLVLTALHLLEALPITSRPIEGNAQLLAWEEWVRLPHEQQTLEKEKKVTAKSIFTLPFRHCPPGHKLFNERCIPQINIDPTDLVKLELLGLVGGADAGNGSPVGNADYDYSEGEDSDELFFDVPLVPLMQTGELPAAGAAEDQALPSEDAPLKFNIFEKTYPTAPEVQVPEVVNLTATASTATTAAAATATATTTAWPTAATMREEALQQNRIAAGTRDLQADSSNAMSSTTTLRLPNSSSGSNSFNTFGNLGNIDAIVLPAGVQAEGEESSVQLVTSSMSEEGETVADLNTDADAQADEYAEQSAEADLAQFLKVDVFHPASGSSLELTPPFSHRRVAPPLSASLEVDESATDIVPAAEVELAAAMPTSTELQVATPTTTTVLTQQQVQAVEQAEPQAEEVMEEQRKNEAILKKSKVQPVQQSDTTATAATTATTAAETTAATAVMATTMPTTTEETATTATTTTTTAATVSAAAAGAETEVAAAAAIHQNANGKASDDDRFYYQHFNRNSAAASSSTSSSSSNTTPSSSNTYEDLDVLNDMASSDNLMTNAIVGQGESDRAASEINFEQELRIINELVKGKRRQQHEQQSMTNSNSSSTAIPTTVPTTTTTIVASSSDYTSSSTAATASEATAAATDSTTFWSKLMPRLELSSTEATTTVTAETAETFTATATTITSNVVDSTTATATATATATTTTTADNTKSTTTLSINNNRSNRNSKITRVDSLEERPTTTSISTSTTTTATAATPTSSNINPEDDGYTPFWWLPSIGWRLDRQLDRNGEDRSLLLRFFRTFGASESDTPATLPLRN